MRTPCLRGNHLQWCGVVPQELSKYEQKLQDLEAKLAEAVFGKADSDK